MTIRQTADLATHDLGHEDVHTKAIWRVVALCEQGLIPEDEAEALVEATYNRGLDFCPLTDEFDYDDDSDESGFDPYMGCYTGDC